MFMVSLPYGFFSFFPSFSIFFSNFSLPGLKAAPAGQFRL